MATQSPNQKFEAAMKAWNELEPMNLGNLTNRDVLKDSVLSLCTTLAVIRPYLVHNAPPITASTLTEVAASLQANIRWMRGILERSPEPKPKAHGKPVTMEQVLPY